MTTHEEQRYAAVNAQIKQLLDEAANDRDPATAILRSLLIAEMHDKNEKTHARQIEREEQPS